jgi:hypothetical protein
MTVEHLSQPVSGAGDGTRFDTNALAAEMAEWRSRLAPAPAGNVLFVPGTNVSGRTAGMRSAPAATLIAPPALREEIEITGTGARARFGPHEVTVASDLRTAGAVELTTPGGLRLRSHVLGLCYFDAESGQSVLIAEPKSRVGEVLYPNRIAFRDALDTVSADVVYTYTRSSLEQDLVLRSQLPSPGELGLDGENIHLAIFTEFLDPPEPRLTAQWIEMADPLAPLGTPSARITDEVIRFGSMRIVEGKAFSLGEAGEPVPVYKRWQAVEGRSFLIEATPLKWIAARLAALPRYAGPLPSRTVTQLPRLLAGLRRADAATPSLARMERSAWKLEDEPGLVLDYLIVNQALLNVDFAGGLKSGPAAVGQCEDDWWNVYYFPGESAAALTDLEWSDRTPSEIGLAVSNAPEWGYHTAIADFMYYSFVLGTNSARLIVTITNLPADVYDVLVYAPRATANGAPVVELKRGGASLWVKNLTQWGGGWMSPIWDEHEQYVRFRDIAVTNQTLTLEIVPDAAGYAPLSGLQIVPSEAIADDAPDITDLLNVNFGGDPGVKVGPAVVGLAADDYWTPYLYNSQYAVSLANLRWANSNLASVGMVVRNAPGTWGNSLPDLMFRTYKYSWNNGNILLTLTNLPAGTYDLLLYGHTTTLADNAVFEVWSDEVNWGIKGTSLYGYGPTSNKWELGQQYVRFRDVAVPGNRPVYIQSKKTTYGYNNLSGIQLVRTGDLDTDADGLPDAWELKWFGNLDPSANEDDDSDNLTNLREYQLGLNPTCGWSDGVLYDWQRSEWPLFDDSTPQGAILYGTWSWVTEWWDGTGWGGGMVAPQSGSNFRVTGHVPDNAHQHYFERALGVMRARTGDVFYAYVNLDSTYPPAEVMLQFQVLGANGSYTWEHRAYWGANNINWGVNDTNSRRPMGDLPATGQWVRLEVPASVVGLEGRIVEGISFALWGGRAAWDSAGIFNPDLDGDGWLDSIEVYWFNTLYENPWDDYDGDGLPNIVDADPVTADTGELVFQITSPPEGEQF